MELIQLNCDFVVCKITSADTVDVSREFTFLSVTDDEISLVCDAANMPANATDVETGWKGLKISGVLDFGMVGVIADISRLLAERKISIFVVSTFNTDYILVKSQQYDSAVSALAKNGYSITG